MKGQRPVPFRAGAGVVKRLKFGTDPIEDINQAWERVAKSDVKYRFRSRIKIRVIHSPAKGKFLAIRSG